MKFFTCIVCCLTIFVSFSQVIAKTDKKTSALPTLGDLRVKSGEISDETKKERLDYKGVTVRKRMLIPDCEKRGISNKIYFLGFEECKHCKIAKPIFEDIVKKENLDSYYTRLDLKEKDGKSFMSDKKIRILYTPTIILNCRAYIGVHEKSYYEQLVGYFKKEVESLKKEKKN